MDRRYESLYVTTSRECVSQFAPAGDRHVWTTDDLLPAFVYVTVRAQLQHLGAEIRLIEDFTPQLQGSGQIELMFTTLRARFAILTLLTDGAFPVMPFDRPLVIGKVASSKFQLKDKEIPIIQFISKSLEIDCLDQKAR